MANKAMWPIKGHSASSGAHGPGHRRAGDWSGMAVPPQGKTPVIEVLAVTPNEEIQEAPVAGADDAELMQRICQVMEEQQLFMNPNLKISDLAATLGTNRSAISACINSQRSCSFPQFVNGYRVAYAQELLRTQPDIKIAEVCVKSGFSSEASFYRIFKAVTGTTPTAWKTK